MSTQYELSYEVPMEMLQRVMTSWARPPRLPRQEILAMGLIVLGGGALGLGLGPVLRGPLDSVGDGLIIGVLIGFGMCLAILHLMHRRTVRRMSGCAADLLARQGPTQAVFSPSGVKSRTKLGSGQAMWTAYDQVFAMNDATALRSGAVVYAIPHNALPEGVVPADFHADLVAWHGAAT